MFLESLSVDGIPAVVGSLLMFASLLLLAYLLLLKFPLLLKYLLLLKFTLLLKYLLLGLGTEFRSEKIPQNRLGMVSVIPRKKVLIPRPSEFRGRANSEARNGTEWNGIPRKNEVLRNLHSFSGHSDGLYILL
jgi:hypothetical protein